MIEIWESDMGMFDTVHLACPNCGEVNTIQSKGGDSVLSDYHGLDNTPSDVLGGLLSAHKVISCSECNVKYRVRATFETFIPDFQTEFAYWCIDNEYNTPNNVILHVHQFIRMHRAFPAPTITRGTSDDYIVKLFWQFNIGTLTVTFDGTPNFIAQLVISTETYWCARSVTLRLSDEILNNLTFLDHYFHDDEDLESKLMAALYAKQPFTLDMNNQSNTVQYTIDHEWSSDLINDCIKANLIYYPVNVT